MLRQPKNSDWPDIIFAILTAFFTIFLLRFAYDAPEWAAVGFGLTAYWIFIVPIANSKE